MMKDMKPMKSFKSQATYKARPVKQAPAVKTVSRDEFMMEVNDNKWIDHPVLGHEISVMQWLDGEGRVRAQAVYQKGGFVTYMLVEQE